MKITRVHVTVLLVTDENPPRAIDRSVTTELVGGGGAAHAEHYSSLAAQKAAALVLERLVGGDNRRSAPPAPTTCAHALEDHIPADFDGSRPCSIAGCRCLAFNGCGA